MRKYHVFLGSLYTNHYASYPTMPLDPLALLARALTDLKPSSLQYVEKAQDVL